MDASTAAAAEIVAPTDSTSGRSTSNVVMRSIFPISTTSTAAAVSSAPMETKNAIEEGDKLTAFNSLSSLNVLILNKRQQDDTAPQQHGTGELNCKAPAAHSTSEETVGGIDKQTCRIGQPTTSSRAILIAVYLILAVVSGTFFFNWPPAQQMYLHAGAYSSLCHSPLASDRAIRQPENQRLSAPLAVDDKEEGAVELTVPLSATIRAARGITIQMSRRVVSSSAASPAKEVRGPTSYQLNDDISGQKFCAEQIAAVDSLMPAGVAAMFASALLGGFCLDYLGPRTSVLLGLTFQLAGWLVLSCGGSNVSSNVASVILIGSGSDPVLLALFNAAWIFPPRRKVTVMSVIASARSLSYGVPSLITMLLNYGWNMTHVSLIYVGILVSAFVVVVLFVPQRSFKTSSQSDDAEPMATTSWASSIQIQTTEAAALSEFVMLKAAMMERSLASLPTSVGGSFVSGTIGTGRCYKIPDGFGTSRAMPLSMSAIAVPGVKDNNYGLVKLNSIPSALRTTVSCRSKINNRIPPWKEFPHIYFPLFPFAATSILCGTYFATSSPEQLKDALDFSAIVTTLTFIPTIILGLLADKIGVLSVMYIINAFSLAQFCLLLVKEMCPIFSFLAAIFGSLAASFFLAQFYCFIATRFSESYFGRSCGFLTLFSGVVSLVATPMCDFSSFKGNFKAMNGLCLFVTTLNFVWLAALSRSRDEVELPR